MSTTRPTDIDAFGQRYLSTLEHLDVKLELLRLKRTLSKGGGVMVMTCIRWSELNEVVAGDCDYHGTLQDFCHGKSEQAASARIQLYTGPDHEYFLDWSTRLPALFYFYVALI